MATKDNFLQTQTQLMEKVVEKDNMAAAYKRVRANKGAPGIDKMTSLSTSRDYDRRDSVGPV